MRFPPSPQFLMNAAAMGAEPVEVAFEELYLALQQGTVDGQENPITNIDSINLVEVQDYISLSSHQLSSNLVIIGEVWNELSPEQQEALTAAVEEAMVAGAGMRRHGRGGDPGRLGGRRRHRDRR